ncbi:MAG: hypothetical protein AAB601_01725 [Patescibacteria group bacterium]
MNKSGSVILLALVAGVVAAGAGIGARYLAEQLGAASHSPLFDLNPACAAAGDCMALECGGRSFIVSSGIAFDAVQRIAAAWCGGATVTGKQGGVQCSAYRRCILGTDGRAPSAAVDLSSLADLEIVSHEVYPNIASAFFVWRTNVPTNSRVVVSREETIIETLESLSGFSTDHRAEARGFESDTLYRYRIEASFQRGTVVRVEGTFRVLPVPPLNR